MRGTLQNRRRAMPGPTGRLLKHLPKKKSDRHLTKVRHPDPITVEEKTTSVPEGCHTYGSSLIRQKLDLLYFCALPPDRSQSHVTHLTAAPGVLRSPESVQKKYDNRAPARPRFSLTFICALTHSPEDRRTAAALNAISTSRCSRRLL